MSRELKFRAWDTKYGIMLTSDSSSIPYIFALAKKDRLTIQQFTGLKDTNGVEIYEGDIIHYKFDGASYPKEACDALLTCVYDADFGGYCFDNSDSSYYYAEIRGYYEVVGNIFDNSDLIPN